jgi:hypothetical protein
MSIVRRRHNSDNVLFGVRQLASFAAPTDDETRLDSKPSCEQDYYWY